MHKTPQMLKSPVRKTQQLFRIVRFCCRTKPIFNAKYHRIFLHAIRLCREEGFSPKEAFRFGLFNPNLSSDELSKYASVKKMTKVLESINPQSWSSFLNDKGIFYRYCTALGIPVPKLYAIFFRKTAGWSRDGSYLKSRDDWRTFFDFQLPAGFVIKPACGFWGRGVNIFDRAKEDFIDASGRSYKSEQIYALMSSDPKYDSFIIQERLINHPELVRFSNVQLLQTVRFVTLIDSNSQCRILHAHLKLITGQNVTDNFQHGLTGNIQAKVFLDDGALKPAVGINPNGSGIRTILNHPKTGLSFDQFKLPLWNQARRLVEETAPRFLPLRTIGWDVALTPKGPFILEANIWWGAPNQHRCMDVILDELSAIYNRTELYESGL